MAERVGTSVPSQQPLTVAAVRSDPPADRFAAPVVGRAVRAAGTAELTELVDAARDGDRAAFDELVRRTYVETYTLAYRLVGDEEDARDVVQEAYLRAFRSLARFRGDARFSTWLYRITANCAATAVGRRRRHRHDELSDEFHPADVRTGGDPEERGEAVAVRAELERALAALPPKLRAVVVLRDIYDLPHEAIAAELGISESAAKVRLHRARRRLREDLYGARAVERGGRGRGRSRAG